MELIYTSQPHTNPRKSSGPPLPALFSGTYSIHSSPGTRSIVLTCRVHDGIEAAVACVLAAFVELIVASDETQSTEIEPNLAELAHQWLEEAQQKSGEVLT